MDETVARAVERAITTMRGNLSDKVTIDDLARSAMFSKFHFSRVFRKITGVSPGRFLSAMRLEEAKRLLLSTNLTVADISHQVGYNSVGTFSSRFRTSVGVSPITYRHTRGATTEMPAIARATETPRPVVRGNVSLPEGHPVGMVFVGLFPTPMLQGSPVRCAVLDRPGPYTLHDVPTGTWHVLAHAVPAGAEEALAVRPLVGAHGPIAIRPGIAARLADLRLHPMRVFDPPVLTALLDLRSAALGRLRTAQQLAEAG
ncbi:helix-turn-helix transcriptional regulator [Actinokineospora guangxiensis]|uniref:Helix-turn-helix transcriptional regulator n=1 Tax=Actinokineospora guangxiensis TaxID=1490288 RepID=A0ABW0EL45_9PSEU